MLESTYRVCGLRGKTGECLRTSASRYVVAAIDALPRNATGKLPRDFLAKLVTQRGRKPALRFTIAPDHPALAGHFPGQPIVPGEWR